MPVANITVAYVNPPKGAAKTGSVKTDAGEYIRVWNDKLSLFAPNGKYTIEYTDENYNGKDYKMFKRMVGNGGPALAPAKANGMATGSPSTTKSEEMAVMGLIGRTLQGSGGLPDEDTLYHWIVAIRGAWTRGFAAQLGPGPSGVLPSSRIEPDDLNDEIPF